MARRFLQILLMISVLCSATAQTLACIPMMQYGDHSCCRLIPAKKISKKIRPSSPSRKKPVQTSHCCGGSATKQLPTPAENSNCKRDEIDVFAIGTGIVIPLGSKETVPSSKLQAPPGNSPPQFILHHSLLI
jgi:hypothetical protein